MSESETVYNIAQILGVYEPKALTSDSSKGNIVDTTNITTNIHNTGTMGDVITAKTIKDSFNTLADSAAPPDLKAALAALLKELERLQQSASPEQAPQVAKAAKSVKRIVEDSSEAEPDAAAYKVSWDGLSGALAKLSDFGAKALELAEKVQPYLPF